MSDHDNLKECPFNLPPEEVGFPFRIICSDMNDGDSYCEEYSNSCIATNMADTCLNSCVWQREHSDSFHLNNEKRCNRHLKSKVGIMITLKYYEITITLPWLQCNSS